MTILDLHFHLLKPEGEEKQRATVKQLKMMMHQYFELVEIAVILSLFIPVTSTALSFNHTTFNDTIIRLHGDATLSSNGIDLTLTNLAGNITYSTGRAVYYKPFHLWDKDSGQAADFITHFTFLITNTSANRNADGFAFFISQDPADQIPSNSGGGYLGLFNSSTTQVIAVEFDTYANAYDPTSWNHMAIDVNTVLSVASVALENASLANNYLGHATVSYSASSMNLSATLSYPDDPNLGGVIWSVSCTIDLRNYLSENVAIGFSGATGRLVELHTIKSWDFGSSELSIASSPVPSGKKTPHRWILQVVVNVAVLLVLGFIIFLVWWYWGPRYKRIDNTQVEELPNMDVLLNHSSRAPKRFAYNELATATNDFSNERKLGQGGFGSVYRGVLQKMDNLEVAIKRISKGSNQGMKEYKAEVTIISQLRHRNLVQLIGYCHDKGEFLLVYEYMPNRSLDAHLYSNDRLLSSQQRYKIALDLASALMYLHDGWERVVVHRDIKPSNVMLDSNFTAKLGDFGLARLVGHDMSLLSTIVAGTRGYMAPEFTRTGKAGKESDVYSFGVVALELACGRKPIDVRLEERRVKLVDWAWELYERRECVHAVDTRLNNDLDHHDLMVLLVIVGLWCAHPDYKLRPTIMNAFYVLNFQAGLPELPPRLN